MLLHLYYLYQKSPKKCRELANIVSEVYQIDDQGGNRPDGCISAMKRVMAKFGAYIAHLCTLAEDSSAKSVDHSKFIGYLQKWIDAKYLLGML